MPTLKQLAANRRNAQHSTGPRTAAGKARSSQNAWKHGFFAQTPRLLPDEDPAEFDAYAAAMMADLKAYGPVECTYASRAILVAWRLRRLDRVEADLWAHASDLGDTFIKAAERHDVFVKLARYQSMLTRELFKVMRELQRLQYLRIQRASFDLRPDDRAFPRDDYEQYCAGAPPAAAEPLPDPAQVERQRNTYNTLLAPFVAQESAQQTCQQEVHRVPPSVHLGPGDLRVPAAGRHRDIEHVPLLRDTPRYK